MNKRSIEEQIVRILQESESGVSARDLCRKHKISEQTYYRWKNKYGGMDVSDVTRLKPLEHENSSPRKHLSVVAPNNGDSDGHHNLSLKLLSRFNRQVAAPLILDIRRPALASSPQKNCPNFALAKPRRFQLA